MCLCNQKRRASTGEFITNALSKIVIMSYSWAAVICEQRQNRTKAGSKCHERCWWCTHGKWVSCRRYNHLILYIHVLYYWHHLTALRSFDETHGFIRCHTTLCLNVKLRFGAIVVQILLNKKKKHSMLNKMIRKLAESLYFNASFV